MNTARWVSGATFLMVAAGAAAVGANSATGMRGSDTVFDFTTALFASCPGVVGPYAAGGSGNGQTAMLSGAQQIAPMSSFLDEGACVGTAARA